MNRTDPQLSNATVLDFHSIIIMEGGVGKVQLIQSATTEVCMQKTALSVRTVVPNIKHV